MKKLSLPRVLGGLVVAAAVLAVAAWALIQTLNNTGEPDYAGQPIDHWRDALADPASSNAVIEVVNGQVIPQLIDAMFHDTNDSALAIWLADTLNGVPGVHVAHDTAGFRRAAAAERLGRLGPGATSAVPALLQAVKGNDTSVYEAAITALGNIHANPDTVIPALMERLDNEDLNVDALRALGKYGPAAKSAVPKILAMLQIHDKDVQIAGRAALLEIDPESAANAGVPTN